MSIYLVRSFEYWVWPDNFFSPWNSTLTAATIDLSQTDAWHL